MANLDHVAMLKQGSLSWNEWRLRFPFLDPAWRDHRFSRAALPVSRQHWAELLIAASSTAAPPTCARWRSSPPHGPGGTATADSPAVIPGRISRPSAPLRSATSTASSCPACGSNPAAVCLRCSAPADSTVMLALVGLFYAGHQSEIGRQLSRIGEVLYLVQAPTL